MNYKQRMIEELVGLVTKIERGKTVHILNENEMQMLDRQLKAMEEYKDILTERIMYMLDDCYREDSPKTSASLY